MASRQADRDAPLRVFTLGIGETSSTAMCQGIARAGSGLCLMAATSDVIVGKCSKLVRASRAAIVRDVTVDWGIDQPWADSQSFDIQRSLKQAPQVLRLVYDASRFVVFAIIPPDSPLPKEVILQAAPIGCAEPLKFTAPVHELVLEQDEPQGPMLHTLAAHRIITDLCDRETGDISAETRDQVIHYGEQYQLASRFTSFVAVQDEEQETLKATPLVISPAVEAVAALTVDRQRTANARYCTIPATTLPSEQSNSSVPPPVPSASSPFRRRHSRTAQVGDAHRASTLRTYQKLSDKKAGLRTKARKREVVVDVGQANDEDKVMRLVRLQSFDGSFALSPQLVTIVGEAALSKAKDIKADGSIWATVVAVAWLQKYLTDQPDLLESLLEKARQYVEQSPTVDFDALLQSAIDLVA